MIAFFFALFASGIAHALTSVNQASGAAQNHMPPIQVQKDTLVVGSEQNYPPFAIGMTDATASGFTVDLWKAVAAEAGLNYNIRVLPFHQILQEFKEGQIDVLINLAISDERQHFADFTVPHVIVHGAIFVRKGESYIQSEDELAGKSIIVLNADLAHDYALSKGWEKQLVPVDTLEKGLRLLASGKHDAMLISKLAGMQTLQELGLTNIEALKIKAGFSQKFAFAVQKGQSDLLSKINEGLALTKSNGTYNVLYNKWFGVYENKEAGLRDFLKYIIPVVIIFMVISGYFFYRRHIEQKESEKKYRDLYDHAPDMFLSVEAKNATITDCNQTLLDITGFSREDILGQSVFEIYHQDCVELARSTFQTFKDTKTVHGVELQLRCKNGCKVDVSLNTSAVCDAQGTILHSRSALRDITERKQQEEMLRVIEKRLDLAMEFGEIGVWDLDLINDTAWRSLQHDRIFGYESSPPEWGMEITKRHVVPEDRVGFSQCFEEAFRTGKLFLECRIIQPDQSLHWINARGRVIYDENGRPVQMLGTVTDITERKRIETALRQKEGYQRALIDNFPFMVWLKDTDSHYLAVNQVLAQAFGENDPDKMVGKNDFDFSSQDLAEGYRKDDRSVLASNERKMVEEEYIDHLGVRRWVETFKAPVIDENGAMLGTVGFARDISDRKKIEMDMRIAATVFESQEGMLVTDANNIILRVNSAFTNITGYTAEEIIGKNPSLLQSGRQDTDFYAAMWESINNTGSWQGEIWNRRKDGEIYPEHLTITAVKDPNDIITNFVATLADITVSKAAMDRIERLAFYDPLTGLPNRRLLQDRLIPALASSHRSGRRGAMLFIDMDNFKILNDTLGHDMGDLLLQQVAQRLESCIRGDDTVARLGGDEFVVMLEDLSQQPLEAAELTEVIGNKILATLNQPYLLAAHEYHSTPSIGATLFSGYEQSIDELMKQADIAMYQAKASGRNALRFFDPEMQAAITARVVLEAGLRQALAENQFKLYYQPQVHHNRKIIGAEVLIRWQHPLHGLISPVDFIALAEETRLILPIGQWVLESACAQIKIWEGSVHTQHLQLAVNVSARQFYQSDFVEQVTRVLRLNAINPDRLKLELTESLVLDDIDDTILKMHALRKIGVRFSMDDFGTGYSSLSSMKKLPLDQLKIDQNFVHDITSDPDNAVIVQTIIAMANKLGMEVIAEGVETEAQRAFLEQHDCPLFQGYLFSKPVPVEQFELFLIDK